MNIERKPLTAEYKVNQIGHYKELMAGAGSKIFKVNPAGVFIGSSSFSSAPFRVDYNGNFVASSAVISGNSTFRGTIYAEAGAIEGDLVVSGSLYSDTGGYRTRLKDGKIEYLYNNSRKAYIMTSDNGDGLQISCAGKIFLTKSNGTPMVEFWQDSSIHIAADSYIQWAGGRKITATGSTITVDGDFVVTNGIGIGSGKAYSVGGSQGSSTTNYGLIRRIRDNGGQLQAKYTEFTFKGGILTNINEKDNWENEN